MHHARLLNLVVLIRNYSASQRRIGKHLVRSCSTRLTPNNRGQQQPLASTIQPPLDKSLHWLDADGNNSADLPVQLRALSAV